MASLRICSGGEGLEGGGRLGFAAAPNREKWGGEWGKTLSTQDLDPKILTLPPNTDNSGCPIILKHSGHNFVNK